MPANVAIIAPQLPAHLSCYQTLINEGVGNAVVQLDTTGFTNVLMQSSTPTAVQRTYSWHNTNDDRVYHWDAGVSAWISRHPIAPGSGIRLPYNGATGDIATEDGGESAAVGDASGPMWELDTTMAGKVFIGAGTLPSGAVLAQGATGGEDLHTLTLAELAAHTHAMTNVDNTTNTLAAGTGTGGGIVIPQEINAHTGSMGSSTPFNVLNPYVAGGWLKRTARLHYRA